ncbi:MAG: Methylase involved in ubiquinone/menaquinone biosynthesis [Myxococcales bacterium]|nr:Methylase involved in ubiquinone/menaquinone biosynthesis [Myxococcales bacterium]
MRDAAIDAAYELGVFGALTAESLTIDQLGTRLGVGARRLRALLDALVAFGVLARDGDRFAVSEQPPRPVVARTGWGLLADVIRRDRALSAERGDGELRYHQHLLQAGAAAARELAIQLPAWRIRAARLLDLGGGAGAYTSAFLDAYPEARATLVDEERVVELAKSELARFGARVTYVAGDARTAAMGDDYDVVLLANVLHLHSEPACRELCAAAARAVAPGGAVAIKDLRMDEDRRGPLESVLFALNMAIYTEAGDVYEASRVCAWLAAAGLVEVEQRTLATSPDGLLVTARRARQTPELLHHSRGPREPP